jgi:hypothetical protein
MHERLFISLAKYTSDGSACSNDAQLQLYKSQRKDTTNFLKCHAYLTQDLATHCNGQQECFINLVRPNFKFGFNGSNCDFKPKDLTIAYECIPG